MDDIFKEHEAYVLSTYTRIPVIFTKGKGMTLVDVTGKKYLDFFPGWGVSNVGHCHPKVVAGVRDQIGRLIHIPNNLYHLHQVKLAKEIIRTSFPGKVFFCNSGTEACEAAIKLARAYGHPKERFEIITLLNSFHGRTLGSLAATGQTKYQEAFGPLVPGFKAVPFNDIEALREALTPQTVAIMMELVQGEGGVHVAEKEYVKEVRRLCDENDILFVVDEVQTGMGRTGEMFAFKHYPVTPDVMLLAKSLGGGLPIGAMVVREAFCDVLKPGMHASTFGGSPLVCKAALGVFKALSREKMLRNAKKMSGTAMERLAALKQKFNCIVDVRGVGLMIGIELNIEGKSVVDECFRQGLIINCTQGSVLRLMPALNVTRKQMNKALGILENALDKVTTTGK